jgi:hypothetical protein
VNPMLLVAAIVAVLSVIGHFVHRGMVELRGAYAQLLDDEEAALRERQGSA